MRGDAACTALLEDNVQLWQISKYLLRRAFTVENEREFAKLGNLSKNK